MKTEAKLVRWLDATAGNWWLILTTGDKVVSPIREFGRSSAEHRRGLRARARAHAMLSNGTPFDEVLNASYD
tara:strand:- start:5145 stop:5360 length:216 start_codon:yes stop_codon:yes gene_type:complete